MVYQEEADTVSTGLKSSEGLTMAGEATSKMAASMAVGRRSTFLAGGVGRAGGGQCLSRLLENTHNMALIFPKVESPREREEKKEVTMPFMA